MSRCRLPRRGELQPKLTQLPVIGLEEALDAAAMYAKGSRAQATWRAYEADWRIFQDWCQHVRVSALPATPHTVALFISVEAKRGRAPATLGRRLAAIRLMHVGAREPSPHDAIEVAEVMRGIRRSWRRPAAQKAPAVDEEVERMADAVDRKTRHGLRDRALLLLGFAGAFRRSELVALDVDHLTERKEGLSVLIAASKTDQEGEGQVVAIARVPQSPYCPVRAVLDWMSIAKISRGPVFRRLLRGDRVLRDRLKAPSVALVVKQLAARVGLDAARYAGHSLRSGFLTSAARNRASIFKWLISRVTNPWMCCAPMSAMRNGSTITRRQVSCNK